MLDISLSLIDMVDTPLFLSILVGFTKCREIRNLTNSFEKPHKLLYEFLISNIRSTDPDSSKEAQIQAKKRRH